MTSKEKLNYLTNLLFKKLGNTDIDLTQEESDNVVNYSKDLRKDLDKLEKTEVIIKYYEKNKRCYIMVKKIKDLTLEEVRSICDKREICYGCPLSIRFPNGIMCIKDASKKEINKKFKEEIEVEE